MDFEAEPRGYDSITITYRLLNKSLMLIFSR